LVNCLLLNDCPVFNTGCLKAAVLLQLNDTKSIEAKKMKYLLQQIIDQVIIKEALINNYPKSGVIFLALDRLFNDPISRKLISQAALSSVDPKAFDAVAGIASRGFIFSGIIANHFSEKDENYIQKVKVKGDPRFVQIDTKTEYSSDELQVLKKTIKKGKKYLLTDDLIASGGSVLSAIKLIRDCGGVVDTVFVMTELLDMKAREQLEKEGVNLISLLQFTKNDLQKLLTLQQCYDQNPANLITYQLERHTKNNKKLIKANQSSDELTVHLASKSALKIEATQLACQGMFDPLNIKMNSTNSESGVNSQPFGYDETIQGATNRLNSLEKSMSPNDNAMLVSIENGLRYSEKENCYYDFVHVIVKKGQSTFSHTQDCCKVPTDIVNAIPKDNNQAFLKTWGEIAKEKGLAKDSNNPHQEEIFGGISRTEHLSKALCQALGQLKKQMMPDSWPEIEAEQVNIKRLLDLNSKKSMNDFAHSGVLFSAPTNSIKSRPINFYNQGIPQSWNIDPVKKARNSFKVFLTGDAFSLMSPTVEIGGAHINIHVGLKHDIYSPLALLQEALQLCRCAYEHGAKSITIALPEEFHPVLHYSDFNSLLIELFEASGANRIYFYDKNYTGKLDDSTINSNSVIPLTITNQANADLHQIDRNDLLNYLHVSNNPQKHQDKLSLDNQVMQHTRQYNLNRDWSKLSIDQTDSFSYVGTSESLSTLNVPEMKAQPHILLCCTANKPLAEEIAASLRSQGEMVKIYHIQGEGAKAHIPNDVAICGAVVTIVQSTRPNPDNIADTGEYQKNGASSYFFEAAMIARQAQLRGAETVNLINPYQFSARSDKAEDSVDGKTGAYVQQNGMLLEAAGVNHDVTAECHDNHTMSGSYTGMNIKGSAVSALSVIAIKIAKQWIEDTDHPMQGEIRLVTPDAGAAKRTKGLTKQLEVILHEKLSKSRVLGEKDRDSHKDDSALIKCLNAGDKGINPKDKYLITDDETATGGTLCQVVIDIKKKGAQDIAVILVHNNMPLEWMLRQLCLARFLYLGVTDLHFSNTQEMGTLTTSYEDLIQKQAQLANVPVSVVEKEVFNWFKDPKNLCIDSADKTEAQLSEQFTLYKSQFQQFESKIKIHSLANEFAHQVATKPYMGNPHAFDYKVTEYINKIKDSQAKSIVVFEGVSVAAASAAALALNLPLQVIPNVMPLPNETFALIGTPSELTLTTLKKDAKYNGLDMLHTSSDPDADLVIHKGSTPISNIVSHDGNLNKLNSHMEKLLLEIEKIAQLKEAPVKLLGIGIEGQILAGQLSYLLNKKGIYVGIAAVDNKQTQHTHSVVYSGKSGDQILSVDRNSLDMGDICIAVANDMTNDTETALNKLATAAQVHCSHCYTVSNQTDCKVEVLDSALTKTHSIAAAAKGGLLFFPNRSSQTATEKKSLDTQNAVSALAM